MTPASKQLHRTLNAKAVYHLGQTFGIARESLNLSQQEVADKLLLSKAQIEGLEVGKQNCFYGAQFYAQCADKYAAFLGLAEQPSAQLLLTNDNEPEASGSSVAKACDAMPDLPQPGKLKSALSWLKVFK